MVTWAPAQAIHRPALGHLTVGSEADVAVLRLEKDQYGFLNVDGSKSFGTQQLASELALRAGKVAWDQNALAADPCQKQAAESFEYKPGLSLTMTGRGAVPVLPCFGSTAAAGPAAGRKCSSRLSKSQRPKPPSAFPPNIASAP